MKHVFSEIYEKKVWYSGSGSGSAPENTVPYRDLLQSYLAEHRIKSVLDIGCGDWQFSCYMDWQGASYVGLDVVSSVIEANQYDWSDQNIRFEVADIAADPLPPADLVLIKDVLQHWPTADIKAFLPKLAGYKHVLITNTVHGNRLNEDIAVGEARPIDLTAPPFECAGHELLRYPSYRPISRFYETKGVFALRQR